MFYGCDLSMHHSIAIVEPSFFIGEGLKSLRLVVGSTNLVYGLELRGIWKANLKEFKGLMSYHQGLKLHGNMHSHTGSSAIFVYMRHGGSHRTDL